MWGFIQTAQQAVFDVVAPALGEGAEVEAAVASGDMGRVARVCEENHLSVSQVRGGNGKNMLHVSCGRGNMEMTQYLLSSGETALILSTPRLFAAQELFFLSLCPA